MLGPKIKTTNDNKPTEMLISCDNIPTFMLVHQGLTSIRLCLSCKQ